MASRLMDQDFVFDPLTKEWLTTWQVTRRLNMPGLPVRWEGPSAYQTDARIYGLTTKEAAGVARQVNFAVHSDGRWEVLAATDVMWARNGLPLRLYGKRLEAFSSHRRKDPDRVFEKELCWQVHEIGLKDALVSLPGTSQTYAVSKQQVNFAEAAPTPLELRILELDKGNVLRLGHPLAVTGWVLDVGRRERPLLGYGDRVYIYRPFESWERERREAGLNVDEALIAICSGLSIMPDDGLEDPDHFASETRLLEWRERWWSDTDRAAMKQMGQLAYLQDKLVRAAMQSLMNHRVFLAQGGPAAMPDPREH